MRTKRGALPGMLMPVIAMMLALMPARHALAGADSPQALMGQLVQVMEGGETDRVADLVDPASELRDRAVAVMSMLARSSHAQAQFRDALRNALVGQRPAALLQGVDLLRKAVVPPPHAPLAPRLGKT